MKISSLLFVAFLLLPTLAPLGAQTPPPEQFESGFNAPPFRSLRANTEKFPEQRIAGRMAMPWNDDSSWCDLDVEYIQLAENPGEGELSQRVVVNRLPKGSRAQFGLKEFPLLPNQEIRLRFLAKSPDYTPVTINVGQRKPPYTTYFAQVIQPSAEWQEFEVLVPGTFDDADTHLLFIINQPGTFDLDFFRAERRESQIAVLSEERLGNLLPSSAFPLGAAPPWVAHGFGNVAVGEMKGPDGAPALVVDVRQQPGFARFEQALRTGFRAMAGKPVTVRVSANLLEGDAQIALRAGVEKIWEPPFGAAFPMEKGWKIYEHTVELPIAPRGYYQMQIAFEGTGRIAIDRIQIAQNDQVFALTGPVELAVDSTANYGLVGEGEPFTIRLAAWGNLSAAQTIRLSLSDIFGNQKELGSYPLPETPYEPQTLELPQPEDFSQFGSFRLEAQALDAQGQPVGIPAEVLLHRVRPARFAGQVAPDSPFGIHYRTSHLDNDIAVLKKLGFNWLRLFKTFAWRRVEATQGQFDFSQTDQDIDLLVRHHFLALGVLGDGAPAWAAKNRDPNFKGWACWTPRDPAEFAAYCAEIFERYGDRVTAFEPWNEPYYPGFFTERVEEGQRIMGSSQDYLTIQKMVFEKARESGKNLQIGWNTNSLEEMPRTKELIDLGILNYTDFVSLHHYLGQPDPAPELTKQVEQMREVMGEKDLPIWNSEGGLGPFTVFNLYKHIPPFQEDQHHRVWAEWYVRYYLACLVAGVEHYFAYFFAAPNFWAPDYSFNNIDGRMSPNLTAISGLAWQVDGTKFIQTVTLSDGSRAHIFEGAGRSVATVQPAPGRERTLPNDPEITAYDLFGNVLQAGAVAPKELHYLQTSQPATALVEKLK